MTKWFFVLVFFCALQVNAQNYSLFENDVRIYPDKVRTTLTHYGEFAITDKFGIADYVFVTNDWGELTVGPYYRTDKFFVTVLPGLETLNKFRIGFYSYYKLFSVTTVSAFYEKGVVDYYDFQVRNDYKHWTFMMRYRQDYGLGVPIGYKLNHFQLFYTTFYDVDNNFDGDWLPTVSLNFEFK